MVSDFKKNLKKNPLRRIFLVLGGVAVLVAVISLIIVNIRIYNKKKQLDSQVEILKNKIEDIKNKNDDLKKGISESDNNQYIEEIAREELDLQKPGEKVISFVKDPNQKVNNEEKKKSILEVWLGWLSSFKIKK